MEYVGQETVYSMPSAGIIKVCNTNSTECYISVQRDSMNNFYEVHDAQLSCLECGTDFPNVYGCAMLWLLIF